MSNLPVAIVKVGGSLFDWPELPVRLQSWLHDRPPALHVLIAGGGPLCDVIRRADRTFRLGDFCCHTLCVDLLSTSARLLAHLLKDVPVISTLEHIDKMRSGRQRDSNAVIFDPRKFMNYEERDFPGSGLRATWDVTSDSIAARIAECLSADELVLLKSCDPPATDIAAAAAAGYVDGFFPTAARPLRRVSCVNLRSNPHALELSRRA